MTSLLYLTLILATASNALFSVLCRINNPIYHKFETAMFSLYILFGALAAWQMFPLNIKGRLKIFGTWAALFCMIRFSLYSAIYGYVAYKNPLYLGDGAWTDRLIKTVLFDWMNQGPGALGFLYVIVFAWSFLWYLGLIFNNK